MYLYLTEVVGLDPVRRRMHALVLCSTVEVLDSSGLFPSFFDFFVRKYFHTIFPHKKH